MKQNIINKKKYKSFDDIDVKEERKLMLALIDLYFNFLFIGLVLLNYLKISKIRFWNMALHMEVMVINLQIKKFIIAITIGSPGYAY